MAGKLIDLSTCLHHKDGGIPLSALPKDTTSKVPGFLFTLSLSCWGSNGKLCMPFFKVFAVT